MAWYDGFADNFGSLGDAIRHLLPDSVGGGYSDEEAKAITDNLEEVQGKTWGDTAADITGIGQNGFLVVGVILLVYLVIKD